MEVDLAPTTVEAGSRATSNYIVSAQKPTVVNACVVGNFRNEDDLDLVVSRVNRIELLLITEEGLKPYREIPVFGRVAVVQAFKPPGEKRDSLLILTSKHQLSVLGFDAAGVVRTRAAGNVGDKVARQAETGILASIHKSGLIALRLYDGLLKIVQWSDEKDLMCFNLRFGDALITDFTFLHCKDIHGNRSSIAYIYQDSNGRHLKVCSIDTKDKTLSLIWKQDNIESEASLLVPVPYYGGVVVVGQESISYHRDEGQYNAVAPPFIHMAQVCCYSLVDPNGERILLGDIQGRLYMIVLLAREGGRCREIEDIKIQLLGEVSIPECIVYLDNSVVFVGSRLGDSQLIRIVSEPTENTNNSYIELIDSYPNLGPIRDLIVVSTDGQNQVVTCSGGYKEGSLRVIRSGIGIEEQAFFPVGNIRHLFGFNLNSKFDNYLVVSFINVTHLFKVDEEDWEDTEIPGFDMKRATLYAGTLHFNGNLLQVTNTSINMIGTDMQLKTSYKQSVSLCAVNPHSGQILIACGNVLHYLHASDSEIKETDKFEFERDISCLDLSTVDENYPSKLAAVGLWDENTVWIFNVDNGLQKLNQTSIKGDVLSRSILLTRMDGILYLLIALGDGTLYYFHLNEITGELTEEKKTTIGTRPTRLKRFCARDATNVFACSDRPAVIYSSNQKLIFSNVNLKVVNEMCPLNTSYFPNSLALADTERLFIGLIDEIQKLHIRSVPLGESVSRIAQQPETSTICILTSRQERSYPSSSVASVLSTSQHSERIMRRSVSTTCSSHITLQPSSGATSIRSTSECDTEFVEIHSVCILDVNTFEVLHTCELPPTEYAVSLCAAQLGEKSTPYYVVGTAYVLPDERECKLGRILILSYENNKLRLIQEKEVKGAVYSIDTLHNKLVCGINSSVRLFAWTNDQELRMESSSFNFVNALYIKTKGDLVLVADIMRSVTMMAYKHSESQFEEFARDYSNEWTTACEIIDADTVIAGENAYNLYTCFKDVQADTEDDRARFQQAGYWYLGENVNVFRRGNLHTTLGIDSSTGYSNPILYGTADGGLGVIVQLPDKTFKYVQELQGQIAKHIKNCTRVSYDDYRNYCTDLHTADHRGFVDGDLIEGLADMSRDRIAKIIELMKPPPEENQNAMATVEQVLRLIEDLSRLH